MNAPSRKPHPGDASDVPALGSYRDFFHNSGDAVVVTDRDGVIVDANTALEEALGYGPDGLIGVTVPTLFAGPEEARRFRDEIRARDHVRDLPLRLRRTDDTIVELWFSVTARRDSHQRVVGYQAIARDLTEERRAIRRLQESERHFRDLIEHSTDLISVIGADGTMQYEGPSLPRVLGYRNEELLGRNVFEYVHPNDLDGVKAAFQDVLEHPGRVLTEELRFRHRDGRWHLIEATGRTLVRDGTLIGVVVNSRDITERIEAERALHESELSFRELFDSVTEMIVIQGADRRFLNANLAACRMFGCERDDLIGRVPSAFADAGQEDTLHHFEAAMRGESCRFDWRGRRPDGSTFLLEISLTRGHYFGQDVVIGVARDMTAQRRLEDRLLQTQKLEAVGRLAGGVAHDFNNVLTAILGNAQLLLAERAEDKKLGEDLGAIVTAAQRAAVLTRQLLAFGRQQIIRPRVMDLNEMVHRAEILLRPLVGESRDLELELGADLPYVEGDPGQLEQVLLNLVMNAVEATPDHSRIRIATTVRTVDVSSRDVDAPPGLYVVLSVEDDGVGMTPEVKAQAFEPFFTTKGQGSGLGLSTVYGIVRQSGGTLVIESRSGAGTRVDVLLPMSLRRVGSGLDAAAEASGGTVLLVEDEDAVRTLACRALERRGYRVIEAENGARALSLCEQDGFLDTIDVLLSDVVMPGMTGADLAARVRELRPDLPVVFMSGHSNRGRPDLPTGPRAAFVAKPFQLDTLVTAVAGALESAATRRAGRGDG